MFTPREGVGTSKSCERLMEKAAGFTSRFDFTIHVTHTCSKGLRRHMLSVLHRWTTDALPQGLCFHYDPLANRVQCPITTLVIGCGLAVESAAGRLSITRVTRALTFLTELGLTTYQTGYGPLIGCYILTDITFTPALFAALDVSEDVVVAAHRSRVEWKDRQRKRQGLDTLGMDELVAKVWRFVRERFRSCQTELKSRGIKRARMRRNANKERQDIVTLMKRQLTRGISEGRFTASREAVKREVERRVRECMILSRDHNYSRLVTASP